MTNCGAAPLVELPELALLGCVGNGPAQRVAVSALRRFSEVGFHATTTRDISHRAGVSAGALYTYFQSKEHILYHWMLVGHRDALRVTREALAAGQDPEEGVQMIVHDLTIWHTTYPTLSRVVTSEIHALRPANFQVVRELRHQIEACMRSPIEQGIAAGQFRARETNIVLNAIFALILDVARWFPTGEDDAEKVAFTYARLAKGMLLVES